MRQGQPAFFALLNHPKRHVAIPWHRDALLPLIAEADIVIEAARPRALRQLGIDADALVRERGLIWITITAHGATGEEANWVGFGDDVAVAAGLSAELERVTGRAGFVGDAIADPLTGIEAAACAWHAWAQGRGGRHGIAMRTVVADAIVSSRATDSHGFDTCLRTWAAAEGHPFPRVRDRRC
jgi:crotonobetainyl-CoA:carnitine CoA-transferase CaiB-like acyl-CoA transferase